ncbi:MAG: zinc ribbon domain-containing protein [Gemmataceae bacterium]|nr:zinc ribbon domain-containing protein [Gemmataceae bacterium]
MQCPACDEPLPDDAVLCVNCGLNLQTGKRLKTVVTKERKVIQGWDRDLGGRPIRMRFVLAAILGGVATVAAVVGGALLPLEHRVLIALLVWLVCGLTIVGVLGTFTRVRVRQDGKGNIVVGIAPSFFFIKLGERTTKLSKFNALWTDYRVVEDSEGGTVWERQILELGSDRTDRRLRVFHGSNGDRMRELCDILEDLGNLEVRRA